MGWKFWQNAARGRSGARRATGGAETVKASAMRPAMARVGPDSALATPRRLDSLAREGFQGNVVAYRAVMLVARGVASVPLRLMRGDHPVTAHPLLALLDQPNPRMDRQAFLTTLAGHHLIAGNGYALAVGPHRARPHELWTLRPDSMKVIPGAGGIPAGYEQTVAAARRRFAPGDVLHWRTFNPLSDWYGLAPLEPAAGSIDVHNEGGRWNLALIQNGGTPSGVLYQAGQEAGLSAEQVADLRQQVEDRVSGPDNAGRPLLLEGGLQWQETGLSPKDMDWQGAKTMAAREIAMAFGVPPQVLGLPDSQTFSNYAQARQSLWEDTILPLAGDMVSQLNRWLVPRFDGDLRLEADTDAIPALEPRRGDRFKRIAEADFLTDREKRVALGYPPEPLD
ncbi:phage portal protein [Yunchengibacter salinarum]|uniref:phage portal protein n=1 Tax=Yunchengibacter salinarum TaxID=3133399 RepID=UPI0035B60E4D